MVPFFYAVVFLQYLTEMDRFPEFKKELALAVHFAMPRDVFAPLPLTLDISIPCDEALKTLGYYECFEAVKEKYTEALKKEGLTP